MTESGSPTRSLPRGETPDTLSLDSAAAVLTTAQSPSSDADEAMVQLLPEGSVNNDSISQPSRAGMTYRELYLQGSFKAQAMNRAFVTSVYFAMVNILRINYYIVSCLVRQSGPCCDGRCLFAVLQGTASDQLNYIDASQGAL